MTFTSAPAYLVARKGSDGRTLYLGEDGEPAWPYDRAAARIFVSEYDAIRSAAREPGAYLVDVEPVALSG